MAAAARLWRLRRCLAGPVAAARSSSSAAPPEKLTLRRQADGVRSIVLNNPKRRNALSLSMLQALKEDLLHDAKSKELRVIVISAEGPVFCSGHDLKELTTEDDVKHHSQVFAVCAEINIPEPITFGDTELFQIQLGTALDSQLYLSWVRWTQ